MAVWLQAIVTLAPKATCRHLAEWLSGPGQMELGSRGGHFWGLWEGGEGFGPDEALIMSVWPDDASAGAAVEVMKAIPQVMAVNGTPLHPTLRPQHTRAVAGDGLWVFHEVHLAASELPALLDASTPAWQALEADSDSEVLGLFRCPDLDARTVSLLLLTRHAACAARAVSRDAHLLAGLLGQPDPTRRSEHDSRTRSGRLQTLYGSAPPGQVSARTVR